MKEMTLDEAIQHCEEVAEENEKFCYKKGGEGGYFNEDTDWNNTKCAAEHRQLARWLKDYKRLLERESCKDAISRETVKTEYKRRLESSLKDESKGIDLTHLADCTKFNEFIDSIPPVNSQHCEDVVSRKEVAEFLRNHAKDFEDARVRMAFMAASSLVENTNNVPSVTSAQGWIPVSERMSEQRVDVWVNSDIGQIQGYYEEYTGVWYASFRKGRDCLELIVNAWMPLPEPYKAESEE